MKAPAFQFYPTAYLADMNVQLLTVEQEGAYIRLLSFCWMQGSIPNDAAQLAGLCKGVSESVISPVIALFQVSEDGKFLTHKRLESERKKQKEWKKKSSDAGKKSANVRKLKKSIELNVNQPSTKVQPDGCDLVQPKSNSLSLSLSLSSKELNTPPAVAFVLPDWIDSKSWSAYEEMRKKKRCPMTDHARNLAAAKLWALKEKGHSPTDVLDNSTMNGYQGLFAPSVARGEVAPTRRVYVNA